MADLIYFCTKENNTCTKKDECKRYVENSENKNSATLFKLSCTEKNNHVLFIKTSETQEAHETKEDDAQ